MSLIGQMYSDFCSKASRIPNFKIGQKEDVPYDITELANGAADAMDKEDKEWFEAYTSALMVRYWHMVPYLYSQSKSSRLDMEDMVMWVWDGLAKALRYRSWLDPDKPVSKDPKGAEKCFNQCITSIRQYWYKHFNTNVSKANYTAASLDEMRENLGEVFEDTVHKQLPFGDGERCMDLIASLFSNGRLFEGLVVDQVCFGECFKEKPIKRISTTVDQRGNEVEEEIKATEHVFDMGMLARCMKTMDDGHLAELSLAYGVDEGALRESLERNTKSKTVERVADALAHIREDREALSILC